MAFQTSTAAEWVQTHDLPCAVCSRSKPMVDEYDKEKTTSSINTSKVQLTSRPTIPIQTPPCRNFTRLHDYVPVYARFLKHDCKGSMLDKFHEGLHSKALPVMPGGQSVYVNMPFW